MLKAIRLSCWLPRFAQIPTKTRNSEGSWSASGNVPGIDPLLMLSVKDRENLTKPGFCGSAGIYKAEPRPGFFMVWQRGLTGP